MLGNIDFVEIFSVILQWDVILMVIIGNLVGLAVGALPGLTATMGLAILLPFTFHMNLYQSIALLIGCYKASLYGGAISAITLGIPGTPAAMFDVLDGQALTKRGQSKKALHISLYASCTSEVLSNIVLLLVIGPLASIALAFGPREMLLLMLVALVTVLVFIQTSPLKGITSMLIGIFIALIGMDPITGVARFTFGFQQLISGIPLLPFLVGLYAFSEILIKIIKSVKSQVTEKVPKFTTKIGGESLSLREYILCYKEMLLGFLIGTFLGALPGPGATLSSATSYGVAKNLSKKSEEFGKGSLNALAAAEAGNSATSGGALIPLFALGIPGSATAALFAGAFMLQGITPGPAIMRDMPIVLQTILILIIATSISNLVLGYTLTPFFAYLAYLPSYILVPFLGVLVALGTYAYQNNPFHVILMIICGVLGYALRAYKFPLETALIGFILTPMIEANLRRSLIISNGNISYFYSSILSIILIITFFLILFFIIYTTQKKKY